MIGVAVPASSRPSTSTSGPPSITSSCTTAVLDERVPHRRITPLDGHVRGARPLRGTCNRAHERCVLWMREHVEHCPAWVFAPTSTARRAYASRRSAAVTTAVRIRLVGPMRVSRSSVPPCPRFGGGRRGSVRRVSGLTPQVLAEITTLGKTVLLIVAITFMVWALYTAMVYPKKHPDFPRDLNLYIVVTAVLFVAQIGAVVWVTGTQEVEHETTTEHGGTTGGETTGGETTGGETTGGEAAAGDAAAGMEVFETAGCASCHTLADAGATGTVGPDLDQAQPPAALVVDRVTNGKGAMPSFADSLDEQQIANVAAYVTSVAGAS